MTNIKDTLDQRGAVYGPIGTEAALSQDTKRLWRSAPGWARLSAIQAHVLEMIAVKVARILNGDPNYPDNWHDIAGYANLAEREIPPPGPTPGEREQEAAMRRQRERAAREDPARTVLNSPPGLSPLDHMRSLGWL